MEKLNNLNEALEYLKSNAILTSDGNDQFVYHKGKISRYFCGSSFTLSVADFMMLYDKTDFYLYQNNTNEIDEDKDEDYYRSYKK